MVPQDAFLFDTTIAENVRFGRPGANADAVRLAFVELGLEAWVDSLADGLDTRVGERGEHLSVGERQLVASPVPMSRTLSASSSTRRPQLSMPRSRPVWRGRSRAWLGAARR